MTDTSDIVQRLRECGYNAASIFFPPVTDTCNEAADTIQALREEVAALERDYVSAHEEARETINDAIVITRENTQLRAQVAVLERDAARYRFLKSDFSPMGLNIDGNHAWAYRRNLSLKGPSLGAAIDAAISTAAPSPVAIAASPDTTTTGR